MYPKRATAHFGTLDNSGDETLVGDVTVEQAGPWGPATVTVSLAGNRSLDEWYVGSCFSLVKNNESGNKHLGTDLCHESELGWSIVLNEHAKVFDTGIFDESESC